MDDGVKRNQGLTAASQVHLALKRDLIGGRFRAGEKLAIASLRQHYGVGLSPLREALNRLAAYGLLEQENQRGFRVPTLSRAELDDIAEMRRRLEVQAMTLALENGDDEWEAMLLAAFHRLRRGDESLGAGPEALEHWEQMHLQFHRCLLAPCGSKWLLRFIEQLHDQFDRYRRLAPANHRIRETLDAQHGDLVALAIERRVGGAVDMLQAHIRLSHEVAQGACS